MKSVEWTSLDSPVLFVGPADVAIGRFRLPAVEIPPFLNAAIAASARDLPSHCESEIVRSLEWLIKFVILRSVARVIVPSEGQMGGLRILAIERGGESHHHIYVLDRRNRLSHMHAVFAGDGPVLKLSRVAEWAGNFIEEGIPEVCAVRREEIIDLDRGCVPGGHKHYRLMQWLNWTRRIAIDSMSQQPGSASVARAIRAFGDRIWSQGVHPLLVAADAAETMAIRAFLGKGKSRQKPVRAPLEGPAYQRVGRSLDKKMIEQRNRLQSIEAYPVLSSLYDVDSVGFMRAPEALSKIAAMGGKKVYAASAMAAMRRAIDCGESLREALQAHFGLEGWMIRQLRGKSKDDLGGYWKDLPALSADWKLIGSMVARRLKPAFHYQYFEPRKSGVHIVRGALAKSAAAGQAWEFVTLVEDVYLDLQLHDYLGFLEALSRWVTARSKPCPVETLYDLIGRPSLSCLIRMSRRWHEIEAHLHRRIHVSDNADLTTEKKNLRWPSLLGGAVEVAGYQFAELTTQWDLEEESFKMKHCVRSYVSTCVHGRSYIFHVSLDGRPAGTLDLRIASLVPVVVEVQQVVGQANAQLDKLASEAVHAFVERINTDQIPINAVLLPETPEREELIAQLNGFIEKNSPQDLFAANPLQLFRRAVAAIGPIVVDQYRPALCAGEEESDLIGMVRRAVQIHLPALGR